VPHPPDPKSQRERTDSLIGGLCRFRTRNLADCPRKTSIGDAYNGATRSCWLRFDDGSPPLELQTSRDGPCKLFLTYQPTALFAFGKALILRVVRNLSVVAHELFSAQSTNEGCPHMTPQASQIVRAFARGESIAQIAA
jgi:hypothetical protein